MNTGYLRPAARWALLAAVPVLAFLIYRGNVRNVSAIVSVEETVLAQQTVALQTLVGAADRGALLNFEQVLVVIDEALVRDLLRAAMAATMASSRTASS